MRHSSGIGVDIVPPMPTHRAPHASLPPPTFLMVLGKLPGKLPVVLTVLPYSAPLQCSYSPKVLLIPPVFLCSPAVVLVLPVLPYSAAHAPKVFLVPPCLLFSPKGLLCSAPLWCSVRSPPPQLQCSLVLLLVLLAPVHPPVYLFLSVIPESPCRFDLHMALVTQTEQGAESACTSVVLGSEARAAKSLSSRRGKQGGCGSWAGCSPSALDFVFLLS